MTGPGPGAMPPFVEALSPNHDLRRDAVRFVILHYTEMADARAAIARLTDSESRVSAHWLVAADGTLVRMVDEERRAWHAGVARFRGVSDLNSASVGIEIDNPGHGGASDNAPLAPYTRAQLDTLVPLVAAIVERHGIDRADVVGHSDVAPTRKRDPGEHFPWEELARRGLALGVPKQLLADPGWPDGAFALALERFGYDIADVEAATRAFQRRFRPARVDGRIDGETRALLFTLQVAEELRLGG